MGVFVLAALVARTPSHEPADVQEDRPLSDWFEETGLDWQVVVDIESPVGRHQRFRPFHGDVEFRGVDVRQMERVTGHSGETWMLPHRANAIVGVRGQTIEVEDRVEFRPFADWARLQREAIRFEGLTDFDALTSALDGARRVIRVSRSGHTFHVEGTWNPALSRGEKPNPSGNAASSNAGQALRSQVAHLLSTHPTLNEIDAPVPISIRFEAESGVGVEIEDLRRHAQGRALIFDPNPVAESGNPTLRDGDPVESYRVWRDLERLRNDGTLRGEWVEAYTDVPPLALEPFREFVYRSTDPRFEQAMAYYHGDRSFQRLPDLGFTGVMDGPRSLRVHGSRLDNSWYSPVTRQIVFGSGGVDDAEDADIILHETGHAIHDALVPGFGSGDTRAISEGFSDYWAASLTGHACVGDWDATTYGPPCLRRADEDMRFPNSLIGNAHKDGRLWSSILWEARKVLGPETADVLALTAFFHQSTDSSWEEAAMGLLQAAYRLGVGEDVEPILVWRGFLAQEISLDLAPTDTLRVDLAGVVQCVGHPVERLRLTGEGVFQFEAPNQRSSSLSPWIVPLAPAEVSEDLRLGGEWMLTGSRLDVELVWSKGPAKLRAAMEWETDTGVLEWTILEVSHPEALDPAWSGGGLQAVGPFEFVDWNAEELAWTGTRGFEGTHDHESLFRAGERFRLESTEDGQLRLTRIASGRHLPGRGAFIVAQPNPFRGQTEITVFSAEPWTAGLNIFDAGGRRVFHLDRRNLPRGVSSWFWDGRDADGLALPAGKYFARTRSGQEEATTPLTLIR